MHINGLIGVATSDTRVILSIILLYYLGLTYGTDNNSHNNSQLSKKKFENPALQRQAWVNN